LFKNNGVPFTNFRSSQIIGDQWLEIRSSQIIGDQWLEMQNKIDPI